MVPLSHAIRQFLDRMYLGCGVLACIFLASIAVLIILQVVTRIVGLHWPGLVDYSTYCMVASFFFGLGPALKKGAHIRVTLLLGAVSGAPRRWLEVLALFVGSGIMIFLAWHLVKLTYESWAFGLQAMGLAATPLWIPQTAMSLGAVAGAIAFVDAFIRGLAGREPIASQTDTAMQPTGQGE